MTRSPTVTVSVLPSWWCSTAEERSTGGPGYSGDGDPHVLGGDGQEPLEFRRRRSAPGRRSRRGRRSPAGIRQGSEELFIEVVAVPKRRGADALFLRSTACWMRIAGSTIRGSPARRVSRRTRLTYSGDSFSRTQAAPLSHHLRGSSVPVMNSIQAATEMRSIRHGAGRNDDLDALVEWTTDRMSMGARRSTTNFTRRWSAELLPAMEPLRSITRQSSGASAPVWARWAPSGG